MEFPTNLATNYFELAVVPQIFWTLYVLDDQSRSGDGYVSFEAGLSASGQFKLLRAERRLREVGRHVFIDAERKRLWVFSFSSVQGEIMTKLIQELGLTASLKDSLWAGQPLNSFPFKSRSKSLPGLNYDPKLDNAESFKHNGASLLGAEEGLGLENLNESPKTIYAKLINALRCSMAFALAHERGWLLLGRDVCIDEESLGLKSANSLSSTIAISFQPQWNSSGSILIHTILSRLPKLSTADDFIKSNDLSRIIGAPVLLPPSGLNGVLRGVELDKERHRRSDASRSVRTIVEDYFQEIGIGVPEKSQWLHVDLDQQHQSQTVSLDTHNSGIGEVVESVWPACYCLCRAPDDRKVTNESDTAFYGNILDPIARAQAWYNDRFERADAVKAEEQKIEREAQLLRRVQNIPDHESFDALSPIDHRTIIQDASGVYPTPPDGVQSLNHSTPMNNEALKPDHNDINGEDGTFADTPYQYSNQDHQDLFGENDMGLTEADFEFFDDLNADNPEMMGIDGLSPVDDVQQDDSNLNARASPVHAQEQILAEGGASTAHGPMVEDQASIVASVEAKTEAASPLIVERRVEELESASSPLDRVPTPQGLVTGVDSKTPIPSHDNDIDRKYSSEGRYGFKSSKELSTPRPITGPSANLKALPELGLLEGSASDTDDTSTLGSDDTDSSPSGENLCEEIEGDHSLRIPEIGKLTNSLNLLVSRLLRTPVNFPDNDARGDSLVTALFGAEIERLPYTNSDDSFIQIAQILIDQAVFSHISDSSITPLSQAMSDGDIRVAYAHSQDIARAIGGVFPQGRRLFLKDIADFTHGETIFSFGPDNGGGQTLFRLSPPHSCIRRMDTVMELLPSAFSFWEELSLAPAHGPKDVSTIGLYPESKHYLNEPVNTFLKMMRDAYQACDLGNHHIAEEGNREYGSNIRDGSFWNLGNDLGLASPVDGTLVVYLINADTNHTAPPELCAGILSLLEGYRNSIGARELDDPPDLVVKIVSQSLVFSPHHLVIPTSNDYKKIAFEVYNRCGPSKRSVPSRLPYLSAPAVYLARSTPKKINFQLATDPTSAALFNDNIVHLAYAWEPGTQWLTASWTDNVGILQWNAAYWIGKDREKPWQPLIETFREITETTLDILRPQSRAWRIFIARSGRLFLDELSSWKLVIAESETTSVTFAFLSVEAETNLETSLLLAPNITMNDVSSILDTPAATPNAFGQSPDAQPSASTPGGPTGFEHDPDARLIDVRDETWAFFPAFDLEDPNVSSKFCRARASAYLLKQASAREEHGVLPLAVRIISGGDKDGSLREVLEMYHKLASLARIRGITDHGSGILPYHVAIASRAHAALKNRMQYQYP